MLVRVFAVVLRKTAQYVVRLGWSLRCSLKRGMVGLGAIPARKSLRHGERSNAP